MHIFILFFSLLCISANAEHAEIYVSHPWQKTDNRDLKNHTHHDFSHDKSWNNINSSSHHKHQFNGYTAQDFKQYFTEHRYTENQILNQRCLYMFDEFVKFAQTYSSYKCTIQQLHAELKNLHWLQKALYIRNGTYCRGLQKRIHYLYHQLDTIKTVHQNNNDIPYITVDEYKKYQAQAIKSNHTHSLSHAIEKRADAYNNMTSADCALQYASKSYNLNNNVKQLLHKYGHDTTRFTQCYGNQLEHVIHQESLDLLNQIDHISPTSLLYDHQEALVDFTVAMVDYNHEGLTDKATQIADLCWTLLDYGQAIAEGAALGIQTAVTDILNNPLEATVSIVASKPLLAYQLSKVLYNVADIGITALSNVDHAKDKWNHYTEPLNNIIDAINKKEISMRDAIKGGTAFAVGLAAQSKLLGGLGKFCNTIKLKATRFAQNNISSFTVQQYLATPEGYLLRNVAETSCSASCPNQYAHLKQWFRIKEFTSIINTTQHGIERLIQRGFTPSDVYDLLHAPSFTKLQNDGAIVYIKKIQNNFNIMALNPTTKKIVTAVKNIDQKALDHLGKNHGWK